MVTRYLYTGWAVISLWFFSLMRCQYRLYSGAYALAGKGCELGSPPTHHRKPHARGGGAGRPRRLAARATLKLLYGLPCWPAAVIRSHW